MLHRISKQNDVNRDKWIGVGGHFEEGESPEACMLREVREETGFVLDSWRFHGVVTFVLEPKEGAGKGDDIKKQVEYMYLFTADVPEGRSEAPLPACDEGVLEWVPVDRVPQLSLWEGDLIFLDLIAKQSPVFLLKLVYAPDGTLKEAVLDGRKIR